MPEGFSDPGVPATRGRRNAEVAARIAQAQQEAETGYDELDAPDHDDDYEQDQGDQEVGPLLLPGDTIKATRSSNVQIDGFEHWFGLEAQTIVGAQEGELPEEALARVSYFVNNGLEDHIAEAEDLIRTGNARRREAERRRPITPRVNR